MITIQTCHPQWVHECVQIFKNKCFFYAGKTIVYPILSLISYSLELFAVKAF